MFLLMKTCRCCLQLLDETSFSWNEATHRYRDSNCKTCRAKLKRQRYVPRATVRIHSFANRHGTVFDDTLYAHLSEPECAYIAGLIDGEGCIGSSQPKNNSNPLNLRITMIHRPTVEWLDEKIGGGHVRHRTAQANARTAWMLEIKGARAYFLLKRLMPYMHTKQEEADVALALGATLFVPLLRGQVTEDTLQQRRIYGQMLRDIKRKEWKVDA